jgi:hypothetical protein
MLLQNQNFKKTKQGLNKALNSWPCARAGRDPPPHGGKARLKRGKKNREASEEKEDCSCSPAWPVVAACHEPTTATQLILCHAGGGWRGRLLPAQARLVLFLSVVAVPCHTRGPGICSHTYGSGRPAGRRCRRRWRWRMHAAASQPAAS